MQLPDYLSDYNRMVSSYVKESDRAAAVLGGSFVETVLGDLLRLYLLDDKRVEELFEGERPLATFSARVSIAFSVGLLPPNVRNDLDLIRKIRNHFAHHPQETSFNVAPVRDICRSFSIVDPKSRVNLEKLKAAPPREQFVMTVAGVVLYMQRTAEAIGSGAIARRTAPRVTPLFDG